MSGYSSKSAAILGLLLAIGLIGLGFVAGNQARSVKMLERVVTVKGLSEREVPADVAIWPIKFQIANNDLNQLFLDIETTNSLIKDFLSENGIDSDEISGSTPQVTDLYANNYSNKSNVNFRYTALNTITVYSSNVEQVRQAIENIVELGKQGVAVTGDQYGGQIDYMFTGLNDLKPEMVEEATANARSVAMKFAEDSNSRLGKIKSARQGQFSINNRDASTPYLKKIRVVSTIEYYLAD